MHPRCLQGKFLQLICEALNKRAVTGARLPFQRFLVFPHLRGDWGDCWTEALRCWVFLKASRQIPFMLPSCPKHVLDLHCLLKKKKGTTLQLSPLRVLQTTHSHCLLQPAGLPQSLIFATLPPTTGIWHLFFPVPEDCSHSTFLKRGFLTLQISALPVSFYHGSSTGSNLSFVGSDCQHSFVPLAT